MNLELTVTAIVNQWANGVVSTIQSKWSNLSGIQGQANATADTPMVIYGNVVEYIRASGFKAFAVEYGIGHLIDTNSPYFEDYKNSDRWNPRREADGNEFIGRAKGETIYRPDGTTDISTGRAEGKRLEHALGNLEAYVAQEPMHIIEENIQASLPDLYARLNEVIPQLIAEQLQIDFTVTI
jgi:hypothetical protein